MFSKRVLYFIVALVLIGIVAVAVQAQTTSKAQRWEYAVVLWNSSSDEFIFRPSTVYEGAEFTLALDHSLTERLWDALGTVEGVGLIDYLAVMGVTGYELVDVSNIGASLFIYHFKRPEKQ